jgi:hypothetical protein
VGDKDPESDDLAEREWDEGLDIGARPRVALGPADGVGMWHGARSIEHPGNGQTAASSTLEYFVNEYEVDFPWHPMLRCTRLQAGVA